MLRDDWRRDSRVNAWRGAAIGISNAEHELLAVAGVRILREPVTEPRGLTEMWIEDPATAFGSFLSGFPPITTAPRPAVLTGHSLTCAGGSARIDAA